MNYLQKADAFARHLDETENGYTREELEDGTLFTFVDERGVSYGVTFPKEGEIRAATAIYAFEGDNATGELMLHMFNQLNTQVVMGKVYRDQNGTVWLSAPFYETGPFAPELLVRLLLAVGKQAGPMGAAIGQIMGALTQGGDNHVQ